MIRPIDPDAVKAIQHDDPFITRILSLSLCYGGRVDFVAFWEQDIGGGRTAVISRFEDKFSLWLTDRADIEEIEAFLSFQGAGSVMYDSSFELSADGAAHSIDGQILEYTGDDHISDKEIYTPEYKEVYGLLKSCESDIFRVPEYMSFLSDLTRRANSGRLSLIGLDADGGLASSVMTVSQADRSAILGAVATRPDCRGRGLSRSLVRTLATRLRREGKRVYVLSASDANTRFYINSGFTIVAGFRELFYK